MMTSSSRDLDLATTRFSLGTIDNMFNSGTMLRGDQWHDDLIKIAGFGAISSDTSDAQIQLHRGHLGEGSPLFPASGLGVSGASLFISHPFG